MFTIARHHQLLLDASAIVVWLEKYGYNHPDSVSEISNMSDIIWVALMSLLAVQVALDYNPSH